MVFDHSPSFDREKSTTDEIWSEKCRWVHMTFLRLIYFFLVRIFICGRLPMTPFDDEIWLVEMIDRLSDNATDRTRLARSLSWDRSKWKWRRSKVFNEWTNFTERERTVSGRKSSRKRKNVRWFRSHGCRSSARWEHSEVSTCELWKYERSDPWAENGWFASVGTR